MLNAYKFAHAYKCAHKLSIHLLLLALAEVVHHPALGWLYSRVLHLKQYYYYSFTLYLYISILSYVRQKLNSVP